MKLSSLSGKWFFAKQSITLFIFLIAILPATYSQAGLTVPWAWKKGSKERWHEGYYGTMGVELAANLPYSRSFGNTFKDKTGNLWLFGGVITTGFQGDFINDLWKYNPVTNNWTWVKGGAVSYGTKGVAALTNNPGGRASAASWVDTSGNFWLFGGYGYDAFGDVEFLNDLWKYEVNSNSWIWISGSNSINASGNYGVQGVAASSNMPPARESMTYWADNVNNLWFYGGNNNQSQAKNDLWRYHIATNTWTWMKGMASGTQPPVYGTKGIAADNNTPGGRSNSTAWIDGANNLYLFGGTYLSDYCNDLWKYSPQNNQWTWIHGDNVSLQSPVMGTQGVPHPQNKPGSRTAAVAFTDMQGNFWLFSGYGISVSSTALVFLNDLWKYSPVTNQWAWMKGSESNANGIYGTQGVPGSSNKPGSRSNAMSWSAPSSDFWLFGGDGYGEIMGRGNLNDLWTLNSSSVVTSTGNVPGISTGLNVYPNPARSQIWFELPADGDINKSSYSIVDAWGRVSLMGDLLNSATNTYSIDVSKLPPGNYILSIKTKKGTKQASIIKQ
jgi:N-acetylneuraminic acid mutarotase